MYNLHHNPDAFMSIPLPLHHKQCCQLCPSFFGLFQSRNSTALETLSFKMWCSGDKLRFASLEKTLQKHLFRKRIYGRKFAINLEEPTPQKCFVILGQFFQSASVCQGLFIDPFWIMRPKFRSICTAATRPLTLGEISRLIFPLQSIATSGSTAHNRHKAS